MFGWNSTTGGPMRYLKRKLWSTRRKDKYAACSIRGVRLSPSPRRHRSPSVWRSMSRRRSRRSSRRSTMPGYCRPCTRNVSQWTLSGSSRTQPFVNKRNSALISLGHCSISYLVIRLHRPVKATCCMKPSRNQDLLRYLKASSLSPTERSRSQALISVFPLSTGA